MVKTSVVVIGLRRVINQINSVRKNTPKNTERFIKGISNNSRDVARNVIIKKRAGFSWAGKGESVRKVLSIPGVKNDREVSYSIEAKFPYADVLEKGYKSGKIPVMKNWTRDSKLRGWVSSLKKSAGITRMPKLIRVAADKSTSLRPVAWGPSGMKFMDAAFINAKNEVKKGLPKLGRSIMVKKNF
jgi:hypothetical protein